MAPVPGGWTCGEEGCGYDGNKKKWTWCTKCNKIPKKWQWNVQSRAVGSRGGSKWDNGPPIGIWFDRLQTDLAKPGQATDNKNPDQADKSDNQKAIHALENEIKTLEAISGAEDLVEKKKGELQSKLASWIVGIIATF